MSNSLMTEQGTAMPFRSAPRSYGDLQAQLHPPVQHEQPAPAAPPSQSVEIHGGIEGRVMAKYADGPACDACFPDRAELTRLAWSARHGQHGVPFVGTGDEWTVLVCAHSDPDLPWRLGDQMVHVSAQCLKLAHDRCLDKDCECECRGSDARQAVTQTESMLAQALREIGGSMKGDIGPEIMARLEALEGVGAVKDARIAELEAALAAKAATVIQGTVQDEGPKPGDCTELNAQGKPCKMHPKSGETMCTVHKAKAEAKAEAVAAG